jgi:hypothetical protein
MKKQQYVFVELYIMLGDMDSSVDGTLITTKEEWEKDLAAFKAHLEAKGISCIEDEDEFFGIYEIDPEAWTVTECTKTEAKVLTKFIGEVSGGFRWPTEYLDLEE